MCNANFAKLLTTTSTIMCAKKFITSTKSCCLMN